LADVVDALAFWGAAPDARPMIARRLSLVQGDYWSALNESRGRPKRNLGHTALQIQQMLRRGEQLGAPAAVTASVSARPPAPAVRHHRRTEPPDRRTLEATRLGDTFERHTRTPTLPLQAGLGVCSAPVLGSSGTTQQIHRPSSLAKKLSRKKHHRDRRVGQGNAAVLASHVRNRPPL